MGQPELTFLEQSNTHDELTRIKNLNRLQEMNFELPIMHLLQTENLTRAAET